MKRYRAHMQSLKRNETTHDIEIAVGVSYSTYSENDADAIEHFESIARAKNLHITDIWVYEAVRIYDGFEGQIERDC